MTDDPSTLCGAATRGIIQGRTLGPCVLRADHHGPVHQDSDGVQWAGDPGELPDPDDPRRSELTTVTVVYGTTKPGDTRTRVLDVRTSDLPKLTERLDELDIR